MQGVSKNVTREQRGNVFEQLRIQCGISAKIEKNTSRRFDLRALVRRVSMKALKSKRRKVFLSILGSCYITWMRSCPKNAFS